MPLEVLVVEDNGIWREELCALYERLLGPWEGRITPATSPSDAARLLRRTRFDLLSLDIILDNGSGLSVLSQAHELKGCEAVIVVSGCDQDEKLELVVDDADRVAMGLQTYLHRLFPGRHLFFRKDYGQEQTSAEVKRQVEIIRQHLGGGRDLLRLCNRVNRVERFKKGWNIVFRGVDASFGKKVGLLYLAHLLSAPRRQLSCFQLHDARMGISSGIDVAEPVPGAEAAMARSGLADPDIRRAFEDLERYRAELERLIDTMAPGADRDELGHSLEMCQKEMDSLFRRETPEQKRMRDAVSRALRNTLDDIDDQLPALGEHLRASLRSGSTWCYEPREPEAWDVILDAG